MCGIVDPGAFEPLRARHDERANHRLVGSIRTNVEEAPDRGPELSRLLDGPCVEFTVAGKSQPSFGLEPVGEARQLRCGLGLFGRRPEHFAFDDGHFFYPVRLSAADSGAAPPSYRRGGGARAGPPTPP